MAEFPAMPLWTDAYLADTHPELSLEEHGCYMLLLQAAWRRSNCDLPDEDVWFCKWLGVHGNKWRVLRKSILERFFTQDDKGNWSQKRLRKERDFVEKTRRNRSESGKKGMEKRWHSATSEANSVITPTPTPITKERDSLTGVQKESASAPPSLPPKHPIGSRIPNDWQPSEEELSYACARGMTYHAAATMAVDFQQYWRAKAGKDAVKLDWSLTWQRWVRNSESFKVGNSGNGRQPYVSPKARIATELFYEMAREFADGDENANRRNIREFTPKLVSLRPRS